MLSEDIKNIITEYAESGYNIKLRDVMFAILRNNVDDDKLCYASIYGVDATDNDISNYVNKDEIKLLITRFNKNINNNNNITYDQNRMGMESDLRFMTKLLKDKQKGLSASEIASLMGKISDIRVKLNDKFGANEKEDDQHIIVNTKYNHVCEKYNIECFFYTKEYAMKHFDLIEKPKK